MTYGTKQAAPCSDCDDGRCTMNCGPAMIALSEAIAWLERLGLIPRVSASGGLLCAYSGDPDEPGTWMQCEQFAIQQGRVSNGGLRILEAQSAATEEVK